MFRWGFTLAALYCGFRAWEVSASKAEYFDTLEQNYVGATFRMGSACAGELARASQFGPAIGALVGGVTLIGTGNKNLANKTARLGNAYANVVNNPETPQVCKDYYSRLQG